MKFKLTAFLVLAILCLVTGDWSGKKKRDVLAEMMQELRETNARNYESAERLL